MRLSIMLVFASDLTPSCQRRGAVDKVVAQVSDWKTGGAASLEICAMQGSADFGFVCRHVRRLGMFAGLTLAAMLGLGAGSKAAQKTAGEDLFAGGIVPSLDFQIGPEAMKTLRDYHQVWRQPRPERIDVQPTVREGERVYTNVALHLKGSFTYQDIDQKPSLTLNFSKFAPGQRFHGLEKISLNNSVQDPSYLSEALARELFMDLGVPSPRAGHALVRINGEEKGLYVLLEGWNKQFLQRHFKSTKGNLYDGGAGGDVTRALKVDCGENPEDRSDLAKLVEAARAVSPSKRLDRLQRVLDVESFRNFAALEILFVHWDGYCAGGPNNYRVFHDVETDKMVFMPHGMDQLFGVSSSTDFSLTPNFNGVVARGLFSIPEERRRYLDRIASLLTNECRVENLDQKVDRLALQLRQALLRKPGLLLGVGMAVDALKARIAARMASAERQLRRPEQPLVFDQTGVAQLSGWRFKAPSDHPASGSRIVEDGRPVLQVHAQNGRASSGAWRTVVLLEEGHYVFKGSGRATGISNAATNTGVILRVSGERSPAGLCTSSSWKPLSYEFDVHGIVNTELVAEFRGAQGFGSFDATDFKLLRK